MSNLDLAKIATHFSCKQEWDNFFLLSLQIIEHPSPPFHLMATLFSLKEKGTISLPRLC